MTQELFKKQLENNCKHEKHEAPKWFKDKIIDGLKIEIWECPNCGKKSFVFPKSIVF